MSSQRSAAAVAASAIVVGGVAGLLLSPPAAFAQNPAAAQSFPGSVPKAVCSAGDHTEAGLQGATTVQERFSGDSKRAYNCNLERIGQQPQASFEGAFSQGGPAYDGVCAYYGTDNDTPLQTHHGVTVIDASDPSRPRVAGYLADTAAALTPHETVMTYQPGHLLAVAQNDGQDFAVYSTADCRHPKLLADITLAKSEGHMGTFAPDGKTYWLTQDYNFGGDGGFVFPIDLTNPSHPVLLRPWHYALDGQPHALELNFKGFEPGLPEGTRLYVGQPGSAGDGPDGLVIEDVTSYQNRRPNPHIGIIVKDYWKDQGTAEAMVPVKINGHPYIISTDEAGGAAGPGGLLAACRRGQSLFGYPNIIDVSDEKNPKTIAKIRLQVSDPALCKHVANTTPPDPPGTAPGTNLPSTSGTTNYSEERCVADNPYQTRMLACSFQNAGLRIFDVRDPFHPRELAYWKPGAPGVRVLPSSGSWAAGVDRTVDKTAGWARWVAAPSGGGSIIPELWTVSDGHGFQVLRFESSFLARHPHLFENWHPVQVPGGP